MPEPQHTFEKTMRFLTSGSKHLTREANQELRTAADQIAAVSLLQWGTFRDTNPQVPKERLCNLFDQVSLFDQLMPRQSHEYGYYMMWGALFGMLIGQLNKNLTTSGRPAACHAAIDYLRHEAAKRGVVFA
jgi:hypothetical protein